MNKLNYLLVLSMIHILSLAASFTIYYNLCTNMICSVLFFLSSFRSFHYCLFITKRKYMREYMIKYRQFSNASDFSFLCWYIFNIRSEVYIKYSNGPNTLPWGTPDPCTMVGTYNSLTRKWRDCQTLFRTLTQRFSELV